MFPLSEKQGKTFPGKARGTADPSASLGMTNKERAVARKGRPLKERAIAKGSTLPTTALSLGNGPLFATTLSLFVIPSEAEGSAVPRTLTGNVSTERLERPAVFSLRNLLRDHLGLREQQQIIRATRLGIRAGHIKPTKRMCPHHGARALAIEVQIPHMKSSPRVFQLLR
jgi:hypothetical protein